MTFDNIRFYQSHNKRLNKLLTRQLKTIPQTLITVDGIGPVLTAGTKATTTIWVLDLSFS